MTAFDISAIRKEAAIAVRRAGETALSYFGTSIKQWEKSPGNPLTEADLAVNDQLFAALQPLSEEIGWLSEESTDSPKRLAYKALWVVDPIDGTRAFIKGEPHFTISVALVVAGKPLLGFVFNPATEEFFTAESGKGAYLNDQLLAPRWQTAVAGCRMIGHTDLFYSKRWPKPWPDMKISIVNSVAYRIALVAAGHADACLSLNPKSDWDLAAAHLILEEAGACLSDRHGKKMLYNRETPTHSGVIAAPPALHALLVEKTATFRPRSKARPHRKS